MLLTVIQIIFLSLILIFLYPLTQFYLRHSKTSKTTGLGLLVSEFILALLWIKYLKELLLKLNLLQLQFKRQRANLLFLLYLIILFLFLFEKEIKFCWCWFEKEMNCCLCPAPTKASPVPPKQPLLVTIATQLFVLELLKHLLSYACSASWAYGLLVICRTLG
jgi:hypothetical protein